MVARTWVVSWLRAAALPFPTGGAGQWVRASGRRPRERALCPLQWRGRAGISPASVSRVRMVLRLSAAYGVVRS